MPPVVRRDTRKEGSPRLWSGWLARALIPVIVLFTGFLAEALAARPVESREAAPAATPAVPDADRRLGNVAPGTQESTVAAYKQRGRQPFAAAGVAVASLSPAAPVTGIAVTAALDATPPALLVAAGRFSPARPRAPPA
jgi:hypothetical protein